MPSFDAVSKLDFQELDNALNQARKEVGSRYDFQGTNTEILLADDKKSLTLRTLSEVKLDAAVEVLFQKMAKRGISLRAMTRGEIQPAGGQTVRQVISMQQGIPVEKAKALVKVIKDSKMKVQGAIQGDALRVTGKSRDDLQEAIALLRGQQEAQGIDLQFENFRD